MTALLIWPNSNQFANCSHNAHIKPGLVKMSAKPKNFNLLEKLKLINESKAKSLKEIWLVSLMFLLVLRITCRR